MANILVQSREFFSQLANGESYSLNLTDKASHLKGSAMEQLKVIYTVDVSWDSNSSQADLFRVETATSISRQQGSFIQDGMSIGDIVDIDYIDSGGAFNVVVTDVTLLVVTDDLIIWTGGSAPGGDIGRLFSIMTVHGKTELTGFDMRFGLIGNDEVFNFQSKVDGSDQIYTAAGVGEDTGGGRITTFIDCESKGNIKGWQSGSAKVRYVSNPSTYVQRFEFEHIFVILPYYLEGELTDLQNGLQPDRFSGDSTLKYAVQLEFRDVLSNPNTAKRDIDALALGSVGGFNQNYNGFNEKYSINSISYEEVSSGNSSDGIIVGSETKVTVIVDSVDSTFVASTSIFGVYHSFLPPNDTYTNNTDVYKDVWLYDNKIQTLGDAPVSSSIITDVEGTFLNAGQIRIEFNVDFTTAQQALIDSEDNYVIGIQVSDTSLDTDDSDKLILSADVRNYIKNADIPGLLEIEEFEFFNHPNDVVGTGFTDYKGWPEDGVVSTFRIFTDLNEQAIIQSAKYRLTVYNSTTEESFDLDEYIFNFTSTFVPDTPGDIQQFQLDTTRGFRLTDDDQFNLVEFGTNNRIVDDQFFNGTIAFKIRWEEWIAQADADPVFFNAAQQNDGLNKKSSNYFSSNGYEIHAVLEFVMVQNGLATTYEFFSPALEIRDYDEDGNLTPDWSGVITTETELGSPLVGSSGPAILTDAETTFKTTWTQTSGAVTDLSDFVVVHRMEERNSQGQQIEELSSLASRAPVTNQKLIGDDGETRVQLVLDSGNVVSTCRIDHEQLDPTKQYDISARLFSLNNTPPVPPNTKLKEDGDFKEKEDDDFKVKE